MAHYILKQNEDVVLVELQEVPQELGLDKIDFNNGLYIEIPENYVQMVKDLIEAMHQKPETDEEGNEMPVWNPTADEVFEILFPIKYYYIKSNKVIELNRMLNPKFYTIGESYEDYLKGQYILLTDEQVHYMLHNPDSNIYLIYHLGVKPQPTLEQVKAKKLMEISQYNTSPNVDQFTINGVIPAWFNPTERTNYALSIQSAKNLGEDTLTFAVGNNVLQVPTDKAEMMLSAIQLYADNCYMVTKQHELAVEALEDIEAVEAYDVTAGYPEHLNFDLV